MRLRLTNKAFTLIELLVVISIVSILSSVVISTVQSARVKAEDTRSMMELRMIRDAIWSYYLAKDKFPDNHNYAYNCTAEICQTETVYYTPGVGWTNGHQANSWVCDAPEDDFDTESYPDAPNVNAWNASMQELVDAGYLQRIPHAHSGSNPYCYFNYVQFNTPYTIIMTVLKGGPMTLTGLPGSERPRSSGDSKCGAKLSPDYCLVIRTRNP